MNILPLLSGGASIFKLRRLIHRPATLHGDTAGSRGVCSLLPSFTKTNIWKLGFVDVVKFDNLFDKSSLFLRRLVAFIFKLRRFIHRPVTLHGDTAGSRESALSCCSGLQHTHTHTQLLLRLMMVSWLGLHDMRKTCDNVVEYCDYDMTLDE